METSSSRERIAVIGGGVTGLFAAYFLNQAGKDVHIFEGGDSLGGSCASLDIDGKPVDIFYHVLLVQGPLREIVSAADIQEDLFPVATTTAYFRDGQVYPLTTAREMMTFSALSFWERFRLAVSLLVGICYRDGVALEKHRASDWLRKIAGDGAFEKFWLPMMRAKFGPELSEIGATDMWFRINRFVSTAFRRDKDGSFYVRGTLRRLVERVEVMLRARDVQITTGVRVNKLHARTSGGPAIEFENGDVEHFDEIVSTIPLPFLSQVVPDEFADYATDLERISYLNNVCLILKTRVPVSTYYQLAISDDAVPFTAIIGGHCHYPVDEYGGYITYISRYFVGRPELFEMTEEELLDSYMPFLRMVNPDFSHDDIQQVRLVRGRAIEPLHVRNYSSMIPDFATPMDGIWCLSPAQIYPEPTTIDTSALYAKKFVDAMLSSRV